MDAIKYFTGLMDKPSDYEKLKIYSNVRDLFFSTCQKFEDNTAILWNAGKVSYAQLLNDALKMSYYLKNNFNKGDHVGLYFGNNYEFVKTFFACSILDLVCSIIPFSIPQEKLPFLCQLFDLKSIICNIDIDEKITKNINIDSITLSEKYWSIDEARNIVIDKNDPACIVFTGGTTGVPKGALLSQKNLTTGAFNGALANGKVFGIKYLSLIPFSHIFGLVKNLLSCIISGSELYIVYNPALFAKEAAMYQPETLVLTPGLCSIVLMLMKNYGRDFFGKEFKTVIAGGAHVSPKIIKSFDSFGVSCLPGYGLTEATNLVSGNGSSIEKIESVGVPYANQELKIVNNELWIKGDNVFLGYYKNEAANKESFEDGWFKTGDLASFDGDGFLYIHGRINNLIVLQSGLKVCPENIESIINLNELVKDCIVRKHSDSDFLFVEILLQENTPSNQDAVSKYVFSEVNEKLDPSSRIKNNIFREEDFKRNAAMKIIR